MARIEQVNVPDIGNFKDVDVIEVTVKVGDVVQAEDTLITLESDKATMDVPAPFAGVVKEILIQVGTKASEGTPVLLLEITETESIGSHLATVLTPSTPVSTNASTSNNLQTVEVPDIGNFKEVDVIEVSVQVGDTVKVEDSLITLESDKATMDVPSPFAGVVKEILIQVGAKASKGTPILVLATQSADAIPAISQTLPPLSAQTVVASPINPVPAFDTKPPMELVGSIPSASVVKQAKEEVRAALGKKAHASPSVRRFARELGVTLSFVSGTGPKGRILKADVQAYVKAELAKPRGEAAPTGAQGGGLGFNLPAWPNVDFAQFGPIEAKPLTRIQKLSGPNLHRNWISIPHVTQFDQADITDLEQFRKDMGDTAKKRDVKLTMLAFLLKASAAALKAYPKFNTSLSTDGTELIYKGYCHIGVAVDTPDGLVVPVVRDVDQKGIFDLAKDLGVLSQKAREKKLSAADMQGGCFTISSLGGIGGTAFTPIINAPEVAILGVSRSSIQPVYKDGQFVPRLMLPLSLSYDHRVIDGAAAARFTNYLAEVLSDIRRLVL